MSSAAVTNGIICLSFEEFVESLLTTHCTHTYTHNMDYTAVNRKHDYDDNDGVRCHSPTRYYELKSRRRRRGAAAAVRAL